MSKGNLPLNQVVHADCVEAMTGLPEASIDLIFADPPYNLQLSQELWRPNMTRVDAVEDAWDHFDSFEAYDTFTRSWLAACRRVLKPTGTLWVIGTYHNIFRIGGILQDLGFWILNDVIWIKTNPMPNFRGVRFTNAHETLIWAARDKGSRYTFNYHAMKSVNDELQMRSDWHLPICSRVERVRENGRKAHSTQKPEALLYRVILASSRPGDVVLDPFFGTGTTGVAAKRLRRAWIGIEREAAYVRMARTRIEAVQPPGEDAAAWDVQDYRRLAPRVSLGSLIEAGLIQPGQRLYFRGDRGVSATVKADGQLRLQDFEGSIHAAGRHLLGGKPCNGWEHWSYEDEGGRLHPLDDAREALRKGL
ncbi:MAG: site-specific DNA-methyltransferase [Actinobacteria bacterium]|nr:site-specific DNA-methyltransferase [Actinomycetota bacterium]